MTELFDKSHDIPYSHSEPIGLFYIVFQVVEVVLLLWHYEMEKVLPYVVQFSNTT